MDRYYELSDGSNDCAKAYCNELCDTCGSEECTTCKSNAEKDSNNDCIC